MAANVVLNNSVENIQSSTHLPETLDFPVRWELSNSATFPNNLQCT